MPLDNNSMAARAIRRSNLTYLIIALVLFAAVIVGVALNRKYLTSFFRGPVEVSRESLAVAADLSRVEAEWAVVEGEYAANTGWVETTQRTRNGVPVGQETVSHSYFILGLSDTTAVFK